MESERYSWTCGWYRSEFKYTNADDAYADAKQFVNNHFSTKEEDIRIWCRKVEEVWL
jgi:hypothetical protein